VHGLFRDSQVSPGVHIPCERHLCKILRTSTNMRSHDGWITTASSIGRRRSGACRLTSGPPARRPGKEWEPWHSIPTLQTQGPNGDRGLPAAITTQYKYRDVEPSSFTCTG
jgi:hypothetical protein